MQEVQLKLKGKDAFFTRQNITKDQKSNHSETHLAFPELQLSSLICQQMLLFRAASYWAYMRPCDE